VLRLDWPRGSATGEGFLRQFEDTLQVGKRGACPGTTPYPSPRKFRWLRLIK